MATKIFRFSYGSHLANNSIFLNIGNGAFLQAGAHNPTKDTCLLKTCITIEKEKTPTFIIEGTVNAAAIAINWQQQQMVQAYSHQQLNELLNTNTHALIFINTLAGMGSPYWLTQQPGQFMAVTRDNKNFSDQEKMQAVIESIIFLCAINAHELIKHNTQLDKIIISGGLANIDWPMPTISKLSSSTGAPPPRY